MNCINYSILSMAKTKNHDKRVPDAKENCQQENFQLSFPVLKRTKKKYFKYINISQYDNIFNMNHCTPKVPCNDYDK